MAKNNEERRYFNDKTLGEFFFNAASKFKDRIYQIDASIDEKESYWSVKQRSVRLAIQLKKKQLTSSDIVVLCTRNSLDNIIPVVAASLLGAKFATIDPTLSERQTTHLISLVEAKFIFVEKGSLQLIERSLENTKQKPEIIVFGSKEFKELLKPDEDEENFRPEKVDENDTAIIFFSSGSTGLPKAICHSHKSFLNSIDNWYGDLDEYADVMLHLTTLYWITGLTIALSAFVRGTSRVFTRYMNTELFFKMIEKYRVTSVIVSPLYSKSLTTFKEANHYNLSSLKAILTGGTGMSKEQFTCLGNFFEDAVIHFGYGMTECNIIAMLRPEEYRDGLIKGKKKLPCGKPLSQVKLKIVDPSIEEVLGFNKSGEIRVYVNSFMTGYYKQSCEDVFDSEGFLKTGDMGYMDQDGFLYLEDRLKEMFKYKCWHVVPSAIEAVLNEHPAVAEAVVFGLPFDEEVGDIPTACVVLNDNARVSEEDIKKFVNERVSDYEKLRGGVRFVKELQKTPTGKFARKLIKDSTINKQCSKLELLEGNRTC